MALLLGLLIVTPIFISPVFAEDDIEGEDEGTVEEEQEDGKTDEGTAAAKSDKDVEEEDEIKPLEPSPNAETVIVFTLPVDPKELPAGNLVKFLVGFLNKGDKDFIVESMEASFRYPMDYNFFIHNYTEATYHRVVLPGQEATFDYAFIPSDSYASRPFGLTINLNYKDSDGDQYRNAVFNQTVNIVEDESGFNPETGFLYLVFACIVILLLLLGQQFLSKMRRKHGMTKKHYPTPVELGTSNKNEVDFEWIPKEVLNHANKSPRVGGSPRNRKARKAGSDD